MNRSGKFGAGTGDWAEDLEPDFRPPIQFCKLLLGVAFCREPVGQRLCPTPRKEEMALHASAFNLKNSNGGLIKCE